MALGPNLLALAVVTVYMRFLADADELVRRIQLEGLAFGFGVIFSTGYQLLERAGAPVELQRYGGDHDVRVCYRCGSSQPAVFVNNSLRVLRAERGWSQAELATLLEVSRQTVNAIKTGTYDPSLPSAFKLARLFGHSIEDMFPDDSAL